MDPALVEAVREWVAADPDPATRAELGALLVAGDAEALRARFAAPLAFGTAGLRGPLRAGPAGMNRAVVRRAAAGLAGFLLRPGNRGRRHSTTVVVGRDARHGSAGFAAEAAAVLAGAGIRALLLPRPLPTPVLAFAVRHLNADAGVMVTASHNPATDNGLKVYLGGGEQVVAPQDAEIEAAIASVGRACDLRTGRPVVREGALEEEVLDAYLTAIAVPGPPADLRVAYTPLHGVGAPVLLDAFRRAGLPAPAVVAEQAAPDPDFPTVPYPDPAEPGTLDLLLALADTTGADIALASDPDADRCAVAVRGARWRRLTGDEVGLLLADAVLATRPGLVATTVVSSRSLGALAAARGVPYAETLTGFKWIIRAGPGLVFGYEEAIGYAVRPDVVRDKDGISAALTVARLGADLKRCGLTLLDRLDALAREIGLFVTDQISLRVGDPAAVVARLRASPPAVVAGRRVTDVADLSRPGGPLPPTDALVASAADVRVVVRPSGTEPKVKVYVEVVTPATAYARDPVGVRAQASATLAAVAAEARAWLE